MADKLIIRYYPTCSTTTSTTTTTTTSTTTTATTTTAFIARGIKVFEN